LGRSGTKEAMRDVIGRDFRVGGLHAIWVRWRGLDAFSTRYASTIAFDEPLISNRAFYTLQKCMTIIVNLICITEPFIHFKNV
jgi:hypothetical protein